VSHIISGWVARPNQWEPGPRLRGRHWQPAQASAPVCELIPNGLERPRTPARAILIIAGGFILRTRCAHPRNRGPFIAQLRDHYCTPSSSANNQLRCPGQSSVASKTPICSQSPVHHLTVDGSVNAMDLCCRDRSAPRRRQPSRANPTPAAGSARCSSVCRESR